MKLKLSHNKVTTFTTSSQHVHNHMETRLELAHKGNRSYYSVIDT